MESEENKAMEDESIEARIDAITSGCVPECEPIEVTGGVGSGKRDGSKKKLANALLRAGYGGLALVSKADEAQRFRRIAEACGRGKDVVSPIIWNDEFFAFVREPGHFQEISREGRADSASEEGR